MDITKDNFEVSLALVEETVSKWADFCAIDLEFTGVETCASKNHYLDTINERYKRIVAHAPDFIIVQFGLCCFKHDSTTNSYLARPFNFSLFPQPFQGIDKRFVCQASSLQFLAKNNFDFNKFVYKGIPYLSKNQEDILRKRGPLIPQSHKTPLPLRDKDITFLSSIWEVLENWQNEGNTEICICLPISSAFQRRLIYQELPKRFPHLVLDTIDLNGGKNLRISVADKTSARERLEQDLMQNIGFRKVIDILINAKKQIVGHNMFLDLIMLFQQFQGPLPENSEIFKNRISGMFPVLVDTKFVATKFPNLQTTNLEELHSLVCKSPYEMPFIALDIGFRNYLSASRFHEAGFDAYVAGMIYLKLISSSAVIVGNLVPIPRSDSILNFSGADMVPDRSRVFHVYGLPDFSRNIQEEKLVKHFSEYGAVSITWIDDVSAFVAIDPPENFYFDNSIRAKICADKKFKVSTYDAFHGMNDKRRATMARTKSTISTTTATLTVSMHESRIDQSLDDLQEIRVHSPSDMITYDDIADYKQQYGDMTGVRFCTLL